jgi:hypothetical protein
MPAQAQLTKSASGVLPYTFDYSKWNLFAEFPIATASVSSTPAGLTLGTPAVSEDGLAVSVVISGGVSGESYTITVTPVTAEGYKDDFLANMAIS